MDQKILEEFKNKLVAEKEQLEGELSKFAKKTGEGEYKTEFPDDLGDRNDENATEVEEYTDKLALEKTLETQLKDVLDALKKMDEGTYGKDEETGDDIDVNRLNAYPAARTNITKE
ncbi:MAG: hypothetical protein ACKUBY_02275 [Candidatus Moraniibacteriota bacterium]|jgi:RNA polymerase-binding transcription factor